MIKVVAKQIVKEDRIEEFVELAKQLVAASVQDPGNVYYTLNRDVKEPTVFAILEAWEDEASLRNHMETETFKKFVPMMGEFLADKAPLDLYVEI